MKPLYSNLKDISDTIDDCLDQERYLPALVLLYAAIDAVAAIERMSGDSIGAAFTRWVERYLLKAPSLRCTALELYAARCGILHTFTAESKLSRSAKARMVVYAYGDADASNPGVSEAMDRKGCVVVHVRDLVTAFQEGLADNLDEVLLDPERKKRLAAAMEMWFTKMPSQPTPQPDLPKE